MGMNREETEKLLDRWLSENGDAMVNELAEWAAIPSVSRRDLGDDSANAPFGPDARRMLDHALKRAEELGFRTEDAGGYCGFAFYGDAPEELGFIAHLDVVPEGQGWVYEPYRPVIKDGFLIGRGVADNKASAVTGLYLMKFFKDNGIRLDRTFRLMLGTAEETGMEDFRVYQERGGKVPSLSIVSDCSFPVVYAEKGSFNADILIPAGSDILDIKAGNVRNAIPDLASLTLPVKEGADYGSALADLPGIEWNVKDGVLTVISHGKGGHAAFPYGSVNALTKFCRIAPDRLGEAYDLSALRFIADTFEETDGSGLGFACSDEETGELTSNAGAAFMEDGRVRLLIDLRLPMSCPVEDCRRRFTEMMEARGIDIALLDTEKAFYIPKDAPVVQMLQKVYAEVTGDTESQPFSMGGGTYSRVIPNAITFGPGLKGFGQTFLPEGHGGAHGPDEVQSIEAMIKAFRIYALAFMTMCGAIE